LSARSALNIKLAEDILTPLQIPLPYTTDGGNLTLEFTIQAAAVRGAAQVFSSDFAFGTYPLAEVPGISGASPTVLAANFVNGNNTTLNSRVYLFNPSLSAGVHASPSHRHRPGVGHSLESGQPGSPISREHQGSRRHPDPSGDNDALYDGRWKPHPGVYDWGSQCTRGGPGLLFRLCLWYLSPSSQIKDDG